MHKMIMASNRRQLLRCLCARRRYPGRNQSHEALPQFCISHSSSKYQSPRQNLSSFRLVSSGRCALPHSIDQHQQWHRVSMYSTTFHRPEANRKQQPNDKASYSDGATSPDAKTPIAVSSLEDKWQAMTHRLLEEISVGGYSNADWNQAEKTLQYWMERKDLTMCWKILDRLCQEAGAANKSSDRSKPRIKTVEHLNAILNLWEGDLQRRCQTLKNSQSSLKDNSNNLRLLPSQVASLITTYQAVNLCHPDKASHSILLKAASQCQHSLPEQEGLGFVDKYFRVWIKEYLDFLDSIKNNEKNLNGKIHLAKPDIVALGTVTHAWSESGHPDAVRHIEQWLSDPLVKQLGLVSNDNDVNIVYTHVMLAYAKAGNPYQVEVWKNFLVQEKKSPPDQHIYGILLNAWLHYVKNNVHQVDDPKRNANLLLAAERAEEILAEIERNFAEGPNIVSYGTVMDIWATLAGIAGLGEKASNRCFSFLQVIQRRNVPGLDQTVYNIALAAFSRSCRPHRGEQLLEEMIEMSKAARLKGHSPSVVPDVVSYSSVIMGWSISRREESGDRGEVLLEHMKKSGLVPNDRVYGNCIKCWASATYYSYRVADELKENAVSRSEALLKEMKELYCTPTDSIIYHSLLLVYLNCQKFDKVEALVESWIVDYNTTKDSRLKPDVDRILKTVWASMPRSRSLFSMVSTAHNILHILIDHGVTPQQVWYKDVLEKSAMLKSGNKALELLLEMKTNSDLTPDIDCYKSVLKSFSISNEKGMGDKTRDLFHEIKNDLGVEPDEWVWNTVIRIVAKDGQIEDALDMLVQLIATNTAKPDVSTFEAVLRAYNKSGTTEAGDQAANLTRKMHQLHRDNLIDAAPDRSLYNIVLSCIARSDEPGAAQRAEDFLEREMKQYNIEPNITSIHTVMDAWSREGNWSKVLRHYHALRAKGSKDGHDMTPNRHTRSILFKAIRKTNQLSELDKDHAMGRISKESFSDFEIDRRRRLKKKK